MNETEPRTEIETPTETRRRRNSRRILIGTLIILVLIAGAAIVASKAGLDKALVRQQLDMIAAQMKERGVAQGRDIAFTYGEIDIKGSFSHKHAVVHDPKLAIKPLEQDGAMLDPKTQEQPHTLLMTSDLLEIYPEAANLSAMRLSLPQPIRFSTIEEPEKQLLTIATPTPLELHFANIKQDGIPYASWKFAMPAQIELTYLHEQQATGEEGATPTVTPVYETLNVTMEKGVGELTVQRTGSGLGQGALELKAIRITPQAAPQEGLVTIAQVLSQWSNQRNERNLNVVNSSFMIDRIEADPRLLPYAPISAAVDVTYEGAMPTSQAELGSIASQESAFKLKTFRITTKDSTFDATADFVANPEDKLPVGMANVTLTNLPFIIGELKKYKLLDDDREVVLAALLQQITGTQYADLKDVAVDVKRSRGGSFQIGRTTFEELFAALLQASLSRGKPPAAVLKPPVEHKPVTPVDLPEQTRG